MKDIVVYDLEANHHQMRKNFRRKINKIEGKTEEKIVQHEVIQIGAVKLHFANGEYQIIERFHSLVKPIHLAIINPYIKKLTGITQEDLNNAGLLAEIFPKFKEFVGDALMISWGTWDKVLLYSSCELLEMEKTWFKDNHVNIQNQVSKILEAEPGIQIGLKTVVDKFEIKLDGDAHTALFDAECAAQIFMILHEQIDLTQCLSKEAQKKMAQQGAS